MSARDSNKPRKLLRSTVKEELFALTGDTLDALILNQMIKYQAMSNHVADYIEEERARLSTKGAALNLPATDGWFYKKASELAKETLLKLSDSNVHARISKLIDRGWVAERSNPVDKRDRVKQYRVNILKIDADLRAINYRLDGWLIEQIKETEDAISILEIGDSEIEIESAKTKNGASVLEDHKDSTSSNKQESTSRKTNNNNGRSRVVVDDSDKFSSENNDDLIARLVEAGLTQVGARACVRKDAPGSAQQLEWLEWHIKDEQAKGRTVENPAGLLRTAIENGYTMPKSLQRHHEAQAQAKRAAATTERERQAQAQRDAENERVHRENLELDAEYDSMSELDKADVMDAVRRRAAAMPILRGRGEESPGIIELRRDEIRRVLGMPTRAS
jgi:DNA-binding MarR family transcriptional regulator